MPKRDRAATEAKHFFDPKSYVDKQGREVLYALDWKQRVGELRDRCGGRCEQIFVTQHGAMRCTAEAADPDHIQLRSQGRDDRMGNLRALCRTCHYLKHADRTPRWTKRDATEALELP